MNLRIAIATALVSLTLGACDQATDVRDSVATNEAGRGPIGKADAVEGSCWATEDDGDVCGGPAPVGNCWCDEACIEYGDCCLDAFDACGVGEPGPAVSECLADAHCGEGQSCSGGVCIDDAPAPCSDLDPDTCDTRDDCEVIVGPGNAPEGALGGALFCVDAPPAPCAELDPDTCESRDDCEVFVGPGNAPDGALGGALFCGDAPPAPCNELDPATCETRDDCEVFVGPGNAPDGALGGALFCGDA